MSFTPTIVRSMEVDEGTAQMLATAYKALVKAGGDSVRAGWRFGQVLDGCSEAFTQRQLADALNLSTGTLGRYLRLYRAYQRPELAVEAAKQLQTFNIDYIVELQNQLKPVEHRTLAGRHFQYHCTSCGSREVKRQEVDEAGNPVAEDEVATA
jgi:hypothetical protein